MLAKAFAKRGCIKRMISNGNLSSRDESEAASRRTIASAVLTGDTMVAAGAGVVAAMGRKAK
jgi:hypothetical protein